MKKENSFTNIVFDSEDLIIAISADYEDAFLKINDIRYLHNQVYEPPPNLRKARPFDRPPQASEMSPMNKG